ncbi:chemotaxis protein CheW [Pseudanabaena sp. FACHB-1277]|jgi:twitching motility protein PilI|uniref:Chemotaxis protein CheW n=1 Tax=Pseudanabaena cinerea FACHB-1277 TaxID=2949581 RepID=A0A926Z4Q7_9CYAN|nr:chemotaxis protein CheW [Pseudanabaena cinerea]MBD2148803.1 chemotaxis protein CheW [Pseudanabaena cinerea FACHB-1277]
MSKLLIELQEDQPRTSLGLTYLTLQLGQNLDMAVPLDSIQETIIVSSERFTQMPNTHPCLIGLIEHRSNVFWVLDLPQLLGFTAIDPTALETHVAILQIGASFIGLAVYRIGQVMRFAENRILSPQDLSETNIPNEARKFLSGWLIRPDKGMPRLYLLNTDAIVSHGFSI